MDVKLLSGGDIVLSMHRNKDQSVAQSLKVIGMQAAVDFSGDGFQDGIVGVNASIPFNAEATVNVDGVDITLSARDVVKFLKRLARPVARQEAMRQVNTERVTMPIEEAD